MIFCKASSLIYFLPILSHVLCTGPPSPINEDIRKLPVGTGDLAKNLPFLGNSMGTPTAKASIAPGKLDPEVAAAIRWEMFFWAPKTQRFFREACRKQAEDLAAAQVKKVKVVEDR